MRVKVGFFVRSPKKFFKGDDIEVGRKPLNIPHILNIFGRMCRRFPNRNSTLTLRATRNPDLSIQNDPTFLNRLIPYGTVAPSLYKNFILYWMRAFLAPRIYFIVRYIYIYGTCIWHVSIFLFRCYKIKLDKINLPNSDLLFSKYVLNCDQLSIHKFKDSDYKPLINWLFGESKIAKSVNLLGCSNDSIYNFLDNIKKRAVEVKFF